ncbi:hypothetical protein AXF42_Ash006192 [Apostasia shenzhenica]|uniref:Seipin-1 n=1 Tax=Apostasia shenzhenica TaxID=1088818 RepID=A0A2I0B0J7_9ASPA|nr:hypothetical protein AXF42_Ash006192 [Apostasia shenzhenica]
MDPDSPRSAVIAQFSAWEEESPSPAGEVEGEKEGDDPLLVLSAPAGWVLSAISKLAEIVSGALLALSYPFLFLFFEILALPSRLARACAAVIRRLVLGLLGAAYAVGALMFLFSLAFVLGVSLVRLWVDEPVLLRRPLYFDYTQAQPIAVVVLGTNGRAVPAGHAVSVSLKLVLPDSGFNRHVGVFQVSAEAISSKARTIAASSQPCMLKFSCLPVRLMKTFIMCVPLLIGLQTESQVVTLQMLRFRERSQKTEMIKVRLAPRSGTYDIPQVYSVEVIICTQLPRAKQVVRNWKWTCYVWVSLYVYVILLILVFCCFKRFRHRRRRRSARNQIDEIGRHRNYSSDKDLRVSEKPIHARRRWRERSKSRKNSLSEAIEGSESSVGGGERSELVDEPGVSASSESSVYVKE